MLHKHLITSFSGGGGLTTLISNNDTLAANNLASSAIRFAFAYAMSERWSLGGHYDRIGTVVHPGRVDRIRFTTYMLEGTYRPYLGRHATLEITLGAGGAIMVLRPTERLIPYEARVPAINLGLRYLHLINETIGGFIAVDHAQAFSGEVTFHDEPLQATPNGKLEVAWHSQRLTAGMFVRF